MQRVYGAVNKTTVFSPGRAAKSRNASEMEMFLRQANHQFKIWKGRPIPTEILKEFARQEALISGTARSSPA